jgi:hypothetical protein
MLFHLVFCSIFPYFVGSDAILCKYITRTSMMKMHMMNYSPVKEAQKNRYGLVHTKPRKRWVGEGEMQHWFSVSLAISKGLDGQYNWTWWVMNLPLLVPPVGYYFWGKYSLYRPILNVNGLGYLLFWVLILGWTWTNIDSIKSCPQRLEVNLLAGGYFERKHLLYVILTIFFFFFILKNYYYIFGAI